MIKEHSFADDQIRQEERIWLCRQDWEVAKMVIEGNAAAIIRWKHRYPRPTVSFEIQTLWKKWGYFDLLKQANEHVYESAAKLLEPQCGFCGGPVPCLRGD